MTNQKSTKKIVIEPVTRVEGHGKVTILLDDNGKVAEARFHVNEFRGFEKFSEGRMFFEMPQITPRICGICPLSHHLCAAKACDAVMGVQAPVTAQKIRELIHMGQYVQSHSMHFFMLAGPDLLLGIDSDPAKRNVFGVVEANPELALKAIGLRKFGQEVIRKGAGRRIHPYGVIAGGVNSSLSEEDRQSILSKVDTAIADIQIGIDLFRKLCEENRQFFDSFASFESAYLGSVNEKGGLELYDGKLRIKDKNGNILVDQHDPQKYLEVIAEKVEKWSYLKFPHYRKLGFPEGVYRAGPEGRLGVADYIETPLANDEFNRYKLMTQGAHPKGPLYYHYARMIEALYAAERIKELVSDPSICDTDVFETSTNYNPEGIGVLEAPRGTLIHHYKVDKTGRIEKAHLIVATGHNNWAMNSAVKSVAKEYIDTTKLTEGMLNRVEVAIRCFDPCLSCSTHAFGQMPLVLELIDSKGNLIDTIQR